MRPAWPINSRTRWRPSGVLTASRGVSPPRAGIESSIHSRNIFSSISAMTSGGGINGSSGSTRGLLSRSAWLALFALVSTRRMRSPKSCSSRWQQSSRRCCDIASTSSVVGVNVKFARMRWPMDLNRLRTPERVSNHGKCNEPSGSGFRSSSMPKSSACFRIWRISSSAACW